MAKDSRNRNFKKNKNFNYVKIAAIIIPAIITFIVYLPSLNNDFVHWDDDEYVYKNTKITTLNLQFIEWAFSTFDIHNWHPLTWISYAIDYSIWGIDPFGYHLTNICIHSLNTFLVGFLVLVLFFPVKKSQYAGLHSYRLISITAFLTAILFGIHPIHVESVAWISERKDVLYAFFYLLSLIFYIRYSIKKYALFYYLLSIIAFLFSVLSKPMAVSLPFVLLIFDFYPLNRIHTVLLKKLMLEKIPFFLISGIVSFIAIITHQRIVATLNLFSIQERLIISVRTIVFYIQQFFKSTNLSPYYHLKLPVTFTFHDLVSIIIVIGITLSCILLQRKNRIWICAWSYYVITLLPTLAIIQTGSQTAADRYTYLPLLGPIFLVALGVSKGAEKIFALHKLKNFLIIVCVFSTAIILSIMSKITIGQISIWKDSISLWSRVIHVSPFDSSKPYRLRGLAFYQKGNYFQALSDYTLALQLDPSDSMAYYYRGIVYFTVGNYAMALKDFENSISIEIVSYDIFNYRDISKKMLGQK